jgi:hypothetical protein
MTPCASERLEMTASGAGPERMSWPDPLYKRGVAKGIGGKLWMLLEEPGA